VGADAAPERLDREYDLIFEAVGIAATRRDSLAHLRPGGAAVWLLGYRSIKLSVHIFIVAEGISILLMFVLAAVIFAKGGAHGSSLSLSPLTPSGASFSGLSAALVFGFLTYIGFEGSATLGEESENGHIMGIPDRAPCPVRGSPSSTGASP